MDSATEKANGTTLGEKVSAGREASEDGYPWLRELRKACDLSLREASNIVDVPKRSLSQYERGDMEPSYARMSRIVRTLRDYARTTAGIDPDHLIEDTIVYEYTVRPEQPVEGKVAIESPEGDVLGVISVT